MSIIIIIITDCELQEGQDALCSPIHTDLISFSLIVVSWEKSFEVERRRKQKRGEIPITIMNWYHQFMRKRQNKTITGDHRLK